LFVATFDGRAQILFWCGVVRCRFLVFAEHWPCEDGCNLCGDNGYMTNGKNSFNYTPAFLAGSTTFKCYDIMYGALVGGLSGTSYCDFLPSVAAEPCGCEGGSTAVPGESPIDQPTSPPVDDADSPTVTPAETPAAGGARRHSGVTPILQFGGMMVAIWSVIVG
jgi:hypothetical protein